MVRAVAPDLVALRPGDEGYEQARAVFNLAGIPKPAEAVVVRTAEHVRAAVRYAAAAARPVRVLSTGHGALSRDPMDDALLIRAEIAGSIRVDPVARTAWVPAGARWEQVVTAAAEHGLTALHGSSPTVGVVGFLLHGGLSFYGRRHGVAANLVRAFELVTADGELMRVDAGHHPELFWALRGGGGGLGIVTAVEIELIPVGATMTGSLIWPAEHAATLVPAWRDWAAEAPREIATSIRLLNLPDLPHVPAPLGGRQSLWVSGTALAGTAAERETVAGSVADLVEPLRALAEPTLDTWHMASPVDVLRTHMDPEFPLPVRSAHCLLAALPDTTVTKLLDSAGPATNSPLLVVELRQLGGAFAEPGAPGGAFDRVGAPWLYYACGVPDDAAPTDEIIDQLATNHAALAEQATPYTAPSFVEDGGQHQQSFDRETARRVDDIRRRYDPDGLFRGDVAPGATYALAEPSVQ